jgi:Tfp pilus assembly protein PilF
MEKLRTLPIDAFARILHQELTEESSKYAFFLGAGCSITSGIPAAAKLVRDYWLPKLAKLHTGDEKHAEEWATQYFGDYKPGNPAASYSKVMEERFDAAQKRQEEIERITRNGKPGYGYSALARLLSHEKHGPRCNVVLTTNFDDLVAEALYLFGREEARPLVIGHEALMSFVRVTRTAPMVVKLHHDRHLVPKNAANEINQLAGHVCQALHNVLQERGLIFMGYGGADPSIIKALWDLQGGLPYGVYWVNDSEPEAELREWLIKREATWVKHRDFDQAMYMIAREFELDEPGRPASFDAIFENNQKKYDELRRDAGLDSAPENAPVREAVQEDASKRSDPVAMLVNAYKLEKTDPDAAEKAYLDGIKAHPDNADLPGQFARFLQTIRKDHDRAEEYYQRAIDADPKHAGNLGNYALFLSDIRKNYDRAEEFYQRAIDADPKYANALGNYALFLENIRKDHDRAEEFYQRAIDADPKHANIPGNYASFLHTIRKDYDRAEEFYKRAIDADPKNAINLGNYALFLENIRQDYDRAEEFYKRALDADPKYANALGNYALFLKNIRKDHDRTEEYYQRAIDVNPKYANALGNYALFLKNIRKDHDRAEEYYQRAIDADPNHANNLGNYASFLHDIRKDYDRAEEYFKRAINADPKHANNLGNYAGFLFARGRDGEGLAMLERCEAENPKPVLLMECRFYRLCRAATSDEERAELLRLIKQMITDGVRSPHFDLSANVERARIDNVPAVDLLAALAKVIADEQPAETLDPFPDWAAAG